MVKLDDVPALLSVQEADRMRSESDPLLVVNGMLEGGDFDGLARILQKKGPARHTAAIPTLLLKSANGVIRNFYEAMIERGAAVELSYCASIAREYGAHSPELDSLANGFMGKRGALEGFPREEFDHFFDVYGNAT